MLTRRKNETMRVLVDHAATMKDRRKAADLLFKNNVPFHVALRVLLFPGMRRSG